MSWLPTFAILPPPPDLRPVPVVEQDILDELEFHLEMRTLENVTAGMSPQEARQDAVRRFGDFERIHKACRRTLLGERIMLQRIQAVLTVVLLGAVIVMGVELYRGQQANEAATALMMQKNEAAAALMLKRLESFGQAATKPPPMAANDPAPDVVTTVPRTADRNVDPSLKEIRVTYNKPMMNGSWSWCFDADQMETTGSARYEADGRTCVLPVKLQPGRVYTVRLNTAEYCNFKDTAGRSAVPYVLQFATRPQATSAGGAKGPSSVARPVDRGKSGMNIGDKVPLPAVEVPPADLVYRKEGSDADAQALVARVLKANHPWLEPTPANATYSLLREAEGAQERSGPFSTVKGCKSAVRVGSIVWTPLHSMGRKDARYTVHMVGKAQWKGKNLVAVDVTFDPPVRSAVGLGGQGNTNYSYCDSSTATARIVLDAMKALPLVIDCSSAAAPQSIRFRCTWAFDPDFFAVNGGVAPKTFYWDGKSVMRERQEFQLVGGLWIFKQGDAWEPPASPVDESRHIQRIRLVDLQVSKAKEN